MKAVFAIAIGIALAGCSQAPADPLCAVIEDPAAYAGKPLTLRGTARMHDHRVGLGSDACPTASLLLKMSDDDVRKAANKESTAAGTFFAQVTTLLGTGASVNVTGRVVPVQGESKPYAFVVESGALN